MRALRILSAATVAAALLSSPAPTFAQPDDPGTGGPVPLARQPDGRLPLEGTPWRLRSYWWKGVERVPGPEVAARMRLEAGRLEASGGCTPFNGTYGTTGSAIDVKLERVRKNDCGEQTTMVQLAMVAGLRQAARFETSVVGGESGLSVFDHGGVLRLHFGLDDVSSFAGTRATTEWLLTGFTFDGTRQDAGGDASAQITFSPGRANEAKGRTSGEVLGSTGCNGFRAAFSISANVMSLGELSTTDAPCAPSTLVQQEAVLDVLEASAIAVSFPPDRMTLTSSDSGTTLEYQAVPSTEGSTWFRSPMPTEGEGDPVTLRLSAGMATGEGPCGPYSAGYVTDGVFITFSDARGSDDGVCEKAKDERRLLTALRSAVRIERDARGGIPPRLTLRDARGKALIRFISPYGNAP